MVVTVVDIIKSKYFVTILNFLLNLKTGNLLNLKFKTFSKKISSKLHVNSFKTLISSFPIFFPPIHPGDLPPDPDPYQQDTFIMIYLIIYL